MSPAAPAGDEETGHGSATADGPTSTLITSTRNRAHDRWAPVSLALGTFSSGTFGAFIGYAANRLFNGESAQVRPPSRPCACASPEAHACGFPVVLLTSAAGTGTLTWFLTGADHMDVDYGLGGAMGSVLTAALGCATAAISDKMRTAARNSAWPSERGREPIELATLNPRSPGQATSEDATADTAVLSLPPAVVADTAGSRGVAPHEERQRSRGNAESSDLHRPGQSALPGRMIDSAGGVEGRRDREDNESIYGRRAVEARAFV